METSTKKCRECKAEIPSDAKVCQFCKAKQWNWVSRHKILTFIFGLIFIGALGSMGGKPNQGTTTAPITTTVTKTPEIPKNEPTISMEEFTKIKNGMTYQEAVTLIGSEGEVLSESEIGNIKTTMYKFTGNSFGWNANITVQNGKIMMKAQFGLK